MYSCMIFLFTEIYQVSLAQLPFFMKVFGRDPSTLENSRTFSSMGHSYPIYSLRQVGPTKDIFLVLVGLVEMATSGTISANGESSVQRLIRALKAFRCFRIIRPTSCFQRWGERENRWKQWCSRNLTGWTKVITSLRTTFRWGNDRGYAAAITSSLAIIFNSWNIPVVDEIWDDRSN